MFKYMVVTMVGGNPHAEFFNDITETDNFRQNVVCGLGGTAQVYELNKYQEYEFLCE